LGLPVRGDESADDSLESVPLAPDPKNLASLELLAERNSSPSATRRS
jgi:hypothetical protein